MVRGTPSETLAGSLVISGFPCDAEGDIAVGVFRIPSGAPPWDRDRHFSLAAFGGLAFEELTDPGAIELDVIRTVGQTGNR